MTLNNWSGTMCVIGTDWGDSGKGRMIDDLAKNADIVARYAGGSNTGHTVENSFGKFALHIVPSGIFYKNTLCLIGKNVAVDLQSLAEEIYTLNKAKVSTNNLIIDGEASLTMPWHKLRDGAREKARESKVGTTGKGVGPTYADRTERTGLLVKDLKDNFVLKLEREIQMQKKIFNLNLDTKKIKREYQSYANKIKLQIQNTTEIVKNANAKGKNVLFEGAQGYFLDIDSGTYPFVTSSNPGVVGVWRSYDLHPIKINKVIGITKAYLTRVGAGPMPTKISGIEAEHLITVGREFGTTTGRKRDVGWQDIELLKYVHETNNLTSLAITKLDVLTGLKKIKLGIGYKVNEKKVNYQPHNSSFLENVKVEYKDFESWQVDISNVRIYKNLPKSAILYLEAIEDYLNIPIKYISVGPKRGQVIYK